MKPENKPMTALELVAAERRRQIEKKGYTTEHDIQHFDSEIAYAAMCYASPKYHYILKVPGVEELPVPTVHLPARPNMPEGNYYCMPDGLWPFDIRNWKPTPGDRIRQLTKAAAMMIAEIERLQALERQSNP